MIKAMFSGISGMLAFKSSLDVIGNNIANVNTTAFKSGRATFKETLSQTIKGASAPSGGTGGTNASQVGLGVVIGSVDNDQTQGSMMATGRTTDLAVEGNGFFALGNGSQVMYTRDGSLALDAENNLVNASTGMKVLGWTADMATGSIDTTVPIVASSSINIPVGGMSMARATSKIGLTGNLDGSAAIGDAHEIRFSVYDSLGVRHEVQVNLTKAANQVAAPNYATWNYSVVCPDVGAAAVTSGQLTFDGQGFSRVAGIPISLTFSTPNGSIQPLTATIDTSALTQIGGESDADMAYNDGLPRGTIESFTIDRKGTVFGSFTNGATRPLGQVALAQFNNPGGLMKSGNNLVTESPNSGSARLSLPGEGGLGLLTSGYLEGSNVDLANEFASMIVAQRGFQASSRIISVSDEVLQELVSLKR